MTQHFKSSNEPKGFYIRPLAPYEDRLLNALAFFRTQRQPTTQAHHCLSMYLRQSESRIMSEIGFYARMVNMDKDELLELIYTDPDKAEQLIAQATGVKPSEVFEADE
jgi:cobalamin-dependent methionine synthase I